MKIKNLAVILLFLSLTPITAQIDNIVLPSNQKIFSISLDSSLQYISYERQSLDSALSKARQQNKMVLVYATSAI